MEVLYTIKITKLAGKEVFHNLEKVVTRVNFQLKGKISSPIIDEVSKDFAIFLTPPNHNEFVPYDNLTEEIIKIWIETNQLYETFCGFIIKELEKKINPTIEKEFDFDKTIFPWVTPIVINGNLSNLQQVILPK